MHVSRSLSWLPRVFVLIILLQAIFFFGIALQISTLFVWVFSIMSFVPAVVMCFFSTKDKYVIISLILLFASQQAIFVFENPSWGPSYGSDAINDLQTASVMSTVPHFDLGKLGYTARKSYSYYPMMHLFSVLFSDVSAIPLNSIAIYGIPFLNAFLVTIALFYINFNLFGFQGIERNLATLLFELGFYYTAFHSQFVRETFAFPLVLLTIMLLSKTMRTKNRTYASIIFLLAIVITLSHQVTSYVFVAILAVLALSYTFFNHDRRANPYFLFGAIVVAAYTAFVTLFFSANEWMLAIEGLQSIFVREATPTVLTSSSRSSLYLSIAYYTMLLVFLIVGGIKLLRDKKKDRAVLAILAFFMVMFILSVLLRLSTSADPWSWTYYMGLRGTIWAFVGISCVATVGLGSIFRITKGARKPIVLLVILICVLVAGKLSQSGSLDTNHADQPVTYTRYVAATWLKGVTVHGSNMFVAPFPIDSVGFEISRDMAPYAYLKEYFIDEERGHFLNSSTGYIPFVSYYFDGYRNSTSVQNIYSNGMVEIGHR